MPAAVDGVRQDLRHGREMLRLRLALGSTFRERTLWRNKLNSDNAGSHPAVGQGEFRVQKRVDKQHSQILHVESLRDLKVMDHVQWSTGET